LDTGAAGNYVFITALVCTASEQKNQADAQKDEHRPDHEYAD